MSKKSRKKEAVRVLKQAVRHVLRAADQRMSGMATGRLAADLTKCVGDLERLAEDDPGEFFWDDLHKAISKLLTCLRRASW